MKILSINSSPRTGSESKTELMLNHLVEGMQDAGADVEVVNLRVSEDPGVVVARRRRVVVVGRRTHRIQMAEPSRIDEVLRAAVAEVESPLESDLSRNVQHPQALNHDIGRRQIGGDGLLAEDRDTGFRGQQHHLGMDVGCRGDDHGIDAADHRLSIGSNASPNIGGHRLG